MTSKPKTKQIRGEPYALEEFRQLYVLSTDEARDLFKRFGPSKIELDLLMRAKGKRVRWNQTYEVRSAR